MIITIGKLVYVYAYVPRYSIRLCDKTPIVMIFFCYALLQVYKYKIDFIEKVNVFLGECREFFMTVKTLNLTLDRTVETTFQIHAYKGSHEENVVRLCRKKIAI